MPGHRLPGFLIDESWLLDAGTVTSVLDDEAQKRIRHIFVTHAYLLHMPIWTMCVPYPHLRTT